MHLSPSLPPDAAPFAAALAGEYHLERELGRGGMGIVYLARDLRLDRAVAIKVLPPELARQGEVRERFLREARTAAQLSHPHIVPIYRADDRAGFAFFAMGFVDGETLAERIAARGRLDPVEVVRVLREVAWALAYAHARGVVHRDVKPANILVERSGRAVVTDFGIARAEHNPQLTQDGHVVGTALYMSPEQAQGRPVDGRSDLYALGLVGYLALSGTHPFAADTAAAVLVAQLTRAAPPLATVAPHVPRALAAVIDQCLAKDAAARPATGEALADLLGKAMEAAEREATPASGTGPAVLSEAQAAAVWQRAAQLQAEAAARLERRAASADSRGAASPLAAPTGTYKRKDVEAAAIEAGISQRYVALAISELDRGSGATAVPATVRRPALGRLLIGPVPASLVASRVIAHPPRQVLAAIGEVLRPMPWGLRLAATTGGHPLDGGVMVFELPAMEWSGQGVTTRWMYLRYGVYARELRITLRPVPGRTDACEMTAYADPRQGVGANLWGSGGGALGLGAAGISVGAAIGVKGMALGGLALAAPIAVGGLALAGAWVWGYRAYFQHSVRRAQREIEAALEAVEQGITTAGIFGSLPPPPPPPGAGGGGDLVVVV